MIEKCLGFRRARKIQRFIRHCKVTILCLLLTIVVLRGTIGAGKFGTPEQDYLKIRKRFEPHRRLREILPALSNHTNSTNLTNYATFDYKSLFDDKNDDGDQEGKAKANPNRILEYSLMPKISNWDEKRENWLKENSGFPNFMRPNKPRVLLVTGSLPTLCDNCLGDHYMLKSIKNKIDYSRIHKIEIFYNMALFDAEMFGFWAKLPLIRTLLLAHPEVEFLWWMDSDALFTNMAFEVPWEKYKDYNFVMHGSKNMGFDHKDWIGLNTVSFLIRNHQWSLDLLDALVPTGLKGKAREDTRKVFSNEKWGDKVYFETAYLSISVYPYRDKIKNEDLDLSNASCPLVTHFVGCKPCGKVRDYSTEKCSKQMDQAFHFADNQILQMYGLSRSSPVSRGINRIRDGVSSQWKAKKAFRFPHRSSKASKGLKETPAWAGSVR